MKSLKDYDEYRTRKLLNNHEEIKNRIPAYCINLKSYFSNMEFVHDEWDKYFDITRFDALNSATNSHRALLAKIWEKKEIHQFPIAVMEDDVFRMNNFDDFYGQLLPDLNCDYVTFDAFFLKFYNPIQVIGETYKFIRVIKHNANALKIYYKRFFDRFESKNELLTALGEGKHYPDGKPIPIDVTFTWDPQFIVFTPSQQVCRQITQKESTTEFDYRNKEYLFTGYYAKYYIDAEKDLDKVMISYFDWRKRFVYNFFHNSFFTSVIASLRELIRLWRRR